MCGKKGLVGLSDDQQAVVKGRALGDFKLYVISRAMRSVYPDFVNRRRHAVIAVVEDSLEDDASLGVKSEEVQGFANVEALIAEYDLETLMPTLMALTPTLRLRLQ